MTYEEFLSFEDRLDEAIVALLTRSDSSSDPKERATLSLTAHALIEAQHALLAPGVSLVFDE